MPLRLRATKQWQTFALPLSYKINEQGEKLSDAQNVFTNQGRLETRFGLSRFNTTSLGGAVLSSSFFQDTSGNNYLIAKVGTKLYSVQETGAHTELLTGLTAANKHTGLTLNNRHIIAIGSDGLYQFDGTSVKTLGQDAPDAAPTLAEVASGSMTSKTWYAAITFYSSVNGFETNASAVSSLALGASKKLSVTWSGVVTAPTGVIDKVRIYLGASGSELYFAHEEDYSTGAYTFTTDPDASTQVPPTTHAKPIAGGGQYLSEFNTSLVYAGNSTYKNDVFFSEAELPDAYDDTGDGVRLFISGDGPITGLKAGYFDKDESDPFLVIFKKRSTHVYTNIGGNARLTTLDDTVGCVSNNTIRQINGDVYFLSEVGWSVISQGRLLKDAKNRPLTLSGGDIDDIFKRPGFDYYINKTQASSFFSVYYKELDQYITFVSEGSSTDQLKAYSFEFESLGFRPYKFTQNMTSGCTGEDSGGNEQVFLSDDEGFFYTHSIRESRSDEQFDGSTKTISAFAETIWVGAGDFDATYNFRELIIKALANDNDISIDASINYAESVVRSEDLDFTQSGFTLDVDRLDIGTLGTSRKMQVARADINRVGEVLLLKFYQNASNSNIGLISVQLDFSKNGNRNL